MGLCKAAEPFKAKLLPPPGGSAPAIVARLPAMTEYAGEPNSFNLARTRSPWTRLVISAGT